MSEVVWRSQNGRETKIGDMASDHLRNAIGVIDRKITEHLARGAETVFSGQMPDGHERMTIADYLMLRLAQASLMAEELRRRGEQVPIYNAPLRSLWLTDDDPDNAYRYILARDAG